MSLISNISGTFTTVVALGNVTPPVEGKEFDYVDFIPDISKVTRSWSEDITFIPTAITYGLTFLLGVIGNGLVVFALLGDRKGRNVTSSFLVSLAVADLLFLLVCVPYDTADTLLNYWAGSRVLCKVSRFVEMLSAAASVLNLTAVSVERYVVIVHPMKARSYCTIGKAIKYTLCVWIAALVLASPSLVVMDTITTLLYDASDYIITDFCTDSYFRSNADRILFAWYQLVIMFMAPVLIIILCYSFVIQVLWTSTKQLAQMTQPQSCAEAHSEEYEHRLTVPGTAKRSSSPTGSDRTAHAAVKEARKRVIQMLLTIIAVFFVCWGPKYVLNVMKKYEPPFLHTKSAFWIKLVINLLPVIQSCMNPIIYSFMSKNFRQSMISSCMYICHCHCSSCCEHGRNARAIFRNDNRTTSGLLRTKYHRAEQIRLDNTEIYRNETMP